MEPSGLEGGDGTVDNREPFHTGVRHENRRAPLPMEQGFGVAHGRWRKDGLPADACEVGFAERGGHVADRLPADGKANVRTRGLRQGARNERRAE